MHHWFNAHRLPRKKTHLQCQYRQQPKQTASTKHTGNRIASNSKFGWTPNLSKEAKLLHICLHHHKCLLPPLDDCLDVSLKRKRIIRDPCLLWIFVQKSNVSLLSSLSSPFTIRNWCWEWANRLNYYKTSTSDQHVFDWLVLSGNQSSFSKYISLLKNLTALIFTSVC